MGIFREIELSWNGQDYKLIPTMKLLRRIERGAPGEGPISIINAMSQSLNGNPQVSIMAYIIQEVMHEAGATEFSDDEVYQEFYGGGQKEVIALWGQVMAALSPDIKDEEIGG